MWIIQNVVSKGDYNYAVVPEHPNATKDNYVLEHRIVMENYLGRLLTSGEVVHHVNGDRKDNRIENLKLLSRSDHARGHAIRGRKYVQLKCPECGIIFEKEKRRTALRSSKKPKATFCSHKCSGVFNRNKNLGRLSKEEIAGLEENFIKEFVKMPL